MDNQQFQRNLVSYQQEQDFIKHLTTLDTGSILLLVTFLEKLVKNPEWPGLIWISLISFGSSIIGCLIFYLSSILGVEDDPKKDMSLLALIFNLIVIFLAFGGFLIGLSSLIVFGVKNIN